MATALPIPTAAGPLLPWLVIALRPMSRSAVKDLLRAGRVAVNGTPTTRHDHPLSPGDRVTVGSARSVRPADPPGLPVLFADDSLIAVNKPSGLLTVATDAEKLDTAFARLAATREARREGRPFVVHRLDRGTSGVLLFALSEAARDRVQEGWDAVEKTYLAVTEGLPREREGRVENFLIEGRDLRVRAVPGDRDGAKRAATAYRVVGQRGRFGLLEVRIETGRKHQIRVHLAGLGCPVAGDRDYGGRTDPAGRLGLHAWKLTLPHPGGGERVTVEAAFPPALRRVVGFDGPGPG